ncbi:hypothetical protein [Frankia sp. Cas4]|uniref:hypothetical protein n=1 Tax=Frankia sp. Cas4 TaxID=3073927 RepID=UPI002AD31CE7|nr:hypothetical protein [Frankia sp. Cas4]
MVSAAAGPPLARALGLAGRRAIASVSPTSGSSTGDPATGDPATSGSPTGGPATSDPGADATTIPTRNPDQSLKGQQRDAPVRTTGPGR